MTAEAWVGYADQDRPPAWCEAAASVRAQVILLGTGQVGRAVLARWQGLPRRDRLSLIAVSNSRGCIVDAEGLVPGQALERCREDRIGNAADSRGGDPADGFTRSGRSACIVIDATASEAVAARHARWLAQGVHVVTANKLGIGAGLRRWRAIQAGARRTGAHYGDAATVGAGLPLLRTLRALRAGGDRIHGFAGVLSGTLAWLFARYDGTRPFSALVREAQGLGYTEPDPWQDLAGTDVVRKLLILARASGQSLRVDAIRHRPLLPPDRAGDLAALDTVVAGHFERARDNGRVLRYVARLRGDGRADVGLEDLSPRDALAWGGGDNRLAITSCRYRDGPLVIQGPGAGADVTAAALLDDLVVALQRHR